jgi:hypothetical protein
LLTMVAIIGPSNKKKSINNFVCVSVTTMFFNILKALLLFFLHQNLRSLVASFSLNSVSSRHCNCLKFIKHNIFNTCIRLGKKI